MAKKFGSVIPIRPSDQYADAFRSVEGKQARSERAPAILTWELGKALVAQLAADFRTGILQSDMPSLRGRLIPTAGVTEIIPWTPDAPGIEGRFTLGFSLSYEHQSNQGKAYRLRVRIFSDAALRAASSDLQFQKFVVWFGNSLATYINSAPFRQMRESGGADSRNLEGAELVGWYELTDHPPIRQERAKRGDQTRDAMVRIGDSIRHGDSPQDDLGTLSVFVTWQEKKCALGAAHIVARRGQADIGTSILWERAGGEPRRPIGLYAHPPKVIFEDEQPAPLDAAVFTIDAGVRVEGNFISRPGKGRRTTQITGHCEIVPTLENRRPPVRIVARGQRHAEAVVVGVGAAVPVVAADGNLCHYEGLLELRLPDDVRQNSRLPTRRRTLTLGGDSGAGLYVVSPDGQTAEFAGLVVCGNSKVGHAGLAYALPAGEIFAELGIQLDVGGAP